MKKPIACIFGHKGGIGQASKEAFLAQGYRIIPVHREVLDLNAKDADRMIDSLLTNGQPDVIVNATGVFYNGWQQDHQETMNVNVGSNWSILRHYMNPDNQIKPTRIIMVGSSSHSGGRKLYPLYSASKAALKAYGEALRGAHAREGVRINVVMPGYVESPMCSAMPGPKPFLWSPERAAQAIRAGIESDCARISFPFPLNLGTWWLSVLPAGLAQWILRRMGYGG